MRNRNGFTLVELIVVIAILGVILVLALPQVSQLQTANKNKKFYAYKDTITSASKIFVDSHKTDLYGNKDSGCVTIYYSDLIGDNLIKPYGEKDISCGDDNKTYVVVSRNGTKYSYTTNVTCFGIDGNDFLLQMNDSDDDATQLCPADVDSDGEPPELSISNKGDKNLWYNAKGVADDLKVQLKVSDSDGLNKNISVKWNWKLVSRQSSYTTAQSVETYTHNYNNKSGQRTVAVTIPEKKVPRDKQDSGVYEITLYPNDKSDNYGVQDVYGNVRYTGSASKTYRIDNEPPTMNPTISSTKSGYNALTTKIALNGKDNVKVDKMYISNKGYDSGGSWETYKSSRNWTVPGSYDGKKRTIYIKLKDSAGNITKKQITYTVYKECSQKVDSGSWYDITSCLLNVAIVVLKRNRLNVKISIWVLVVVLEIRLVLLVTDVIVVVV